LSERIFDTRVTKKGQVLIPKPLRDRFGIREDSRVRLVATEEGVLIRPALLKPWSGLRGVLRDTLTIDELERLLEEAKRLKVDRYPSLDEVSQTRPRLATSAGKTVRKMRDERSRRLLGHE